MPLTTPTHRQDPPQIRESDARSRTLLESIGLPLVALDAAFQVVYCNPAYATRVGVPASQLLGRSLFESLPQFPGSACHQVCLQSLQTRAPQAVEERIDERYHLIRAYPTPNGVMALFADVTAHRQLEDELVLSALRARLVLEQVPAIHWTIDNELRFTQSLGAGLKDINLRPGEVVGQTLFEFFNTCDPNNSHIRMHRQALEGQRVSYLAEHAGRAYECVLEPLRDHGGGIQGAIGVAHDVTERRRTELERHRLEQQILRTQKLESLGLLASGVAHDFNNLLVGILGTAEVLLRDLPADSPQRALVELVKKAGENAADLTRKMLVYAGKSPTAPQAMDLNHLLRDLQPLVAAAVRKSIVIEAPLALELPPVYADPGQIQQVIMNLVMNASEAVRQRGSTIRLSTGVLDVDEPAAAKDPELPVGRHVYVEVKDDGCGMTPDVLARIYDPFFTTKAAGRGLGMSVVLGIIRAHHGAIRVQSVPGEGTIFRVLLPVGETPPSPTPAKPRSWNHQLVLVIDDEACVRDVTARALSGTGVGVLSAGTRQEGIELLRRHGDRVAVVLLNLIMPGLSLEETLRSFRSIKSDIRVVLTTGHDPAEAMRLCNEWGLAAFLTKPYRLDVLMEQVKNALI